MLDEGQTVSREDNYTCSPFRGLLEIQSLEHTSFNRSHYALKLRVLNDQDVCLGCVEFRLAAFPGWQILNSTGEIF